MVKQIRYGVRPSVLKRTMIWNRPLKGRKSLEDLRADGIPQCFNYARIACRFEEQIIKLRKMTFSAINGLAMTQIFFPKAAL